jgi:hypothetical protein
MIRPWEYLNSIQFPKYFENHLDIHMILWGGEVFHSDIVSVFHHFYFIVFPMVSAAQPNIVAVHAINISKPLTCHAKAFGSEAELGPAGFKVASI